MKKKQMNKNKETCFRYYQLLTCFSVKNRYKKIPLRIRWRIHISLKVATYTNVSQETQKWSTALRIHFKCSNIFELWMSDWFAKLNSTKIEQWWCFFRKKKYLKIYICCFLSRSWGKITRNIMLGLKNKSAVASMLKLAWSFWFPLCLFLN